MCSARKEAGTAQSRTSRERKTFTENTNWKGDEMKKYFASIDSLEVHVKGLLPQFLGEALIIFCGLAFLSWLLRPSTGTFWLGAVVGVSALFATWAYRLIYYSKIRVKIGEYDITKSEGLFDLSRKVIRFEKITNITITRSLPERILSLASVDIQTAGSPDIEMHIPFVDANTAGKIR